MCVVKYCTLGSSIWRLMSYVVLFLAVFTSETEAQLTIDHSSNAVFKRIFYVIDNIEYLRCYQGAHVSAIRAMKSQFARNIALEIFCI